MLMSNSSNQECYNAQISMTPQHRFPRKIAKLNHLSLSAARRNFSYASNLQSFTEPIA